MAGLPLPYLQKLLGHSDINTTMIYVHLAPSAHLSVVDILDQRAVKLLSDDVDHG